MESFVDRAREYANALMKAGGFSYEEVSVMTGHTCSNNQKLFIG